MLVKAALMTGLWITYLYTMTNNKKTTKQHIYTQQNKNNSLPPQKKLKVTIISCQGSEVILVEQK